MATPQTIVPTEGKVPPNAFANEPDPPAIETAEAETQVEEAVPAQQPSDEDRAVEQEARTSGWVSKDEWVDSHGSEKGWKPAADYVDFRRNFLPIVTKENRELRSELAQLKQNLAERDRKEAETRQTFERERLQLDLEQAVENGDKQQVRDITNKLFDLKLAQSKTPVPQQQQIDPNLRREFEDFAAANKWLKDDPKLAKVFAVQLKGIMDTGAAGNIPDALEDAKDMTRRMYPEKFQKKPAMAEGRGEHGTARSSAKTWNDVTPEYREVYNDAYFRMNPEVKRENLLKQLPDSAFKGRP